MSQARASTTPAEPDPELERIADELYAMRPDAFATARDEAVRTARAEKRQPLARELTQLRRPTQSAWLINLLWREQRAVLDQLFEVGEGMRRAQESASGPELQRLTAQRRELEAALLRQARALADKAGVSVSPAMEREFQETLGAALARTDVADEIRTGRLVKPATYAGFGPLVSSTPAPGRTEPSPAAPHPPEPEPITARADQRAGERRAQAEARVAEARAAVDEAASALADDARAAEAADHEHQVAREKIEQLRQQVTMLEGEAAVAERAARVATRHREQAEQAHQAALRALGRAEQQLRELTA